LLLKNYLQTIQSQAAESIISLKKSFKIDEDTNNTNELNKWLRELQTKNNEFENTKQSIGKLKTKKNAQ